MYILLILFLIDQQKPPVRSASCSDKPARHFGRVVPLNICFIYLHVCIMIEIEHHRANTYPRQAGGSLLQQSCAHDVRRKLEYAIPEEQSSQVCKANVVFVMYVHDVHIVV